MRSQGHPGPKTQHCKEQSEEPPGSAEIIDRVTTVQKDGTSKAKARVILLGCTHPDSVVRDLRGAKVLKSASPTTTRRGK